MKKTANVKTEAQYAGKVKPCIRPAEKIFNAHFNDDVKWENVNRILKIKAQNEESVKAFIEIFSGFYDCRIQVKLYENELIKAYFDAFVNTTSGESSLDLMVEIFDEIKDGFRFVAETNYFIEKGVRELFDEFDVEYDEVDSIIGFLESMAPAERFNVRSIQS